MSNSEKIEPVVNNSAGAIVTLAELSYDEERELLRLERIVEQAFYKAGSALASIKSLKLYRGRYETFEQYCRDRFNYNRVYCYRLIEAAAVVENIGGKCCPMGNKELPQSSEMILPTSERQVRPLIGLLPQQQKQVWDKAVKLANNKVPSGRIVKEVKDSMYPSNVSELKVAKHLKLTPRALVEINAPWSSDAHGKYARICLAHKNKVEVWIRDLATMTMHKETFKYSEVEPVPFEKEPQLLEVRQRIAKLREKKLDPFEEDILMMLERPVSFSPIELEYLRQIEERYQ